MTPWKAWNKQKARLDVLFAAEEHVQVEATWGIYQRMIAAYRDPNKAQGSKTMQALIDSLRHGVPTALIELHRLGRTLSRRTANVLAYRIANVLAYFDPHGTSNAPPKRSTARLEHLRGSALGFRNLTQLHRQV